MFLRIPRLKFAGCEIDRAINTLNTHAGLRQHACKGKHVFLELEQFVQQTVYIISIEKYHHTWVYPSKCMHVCALLFFFFFFFLLLLLL